jgi:hypothetical protein
VVVLIVVVVVFIGCRTIAETRPEKEKKEIQRKRNNGSCRLERHEILSPLFNEMSRSASAVAVHRPLLEKQKKEEKTLANEMLDGCL